jgi:hypothetical protein
MIVDEKYLFEQATPEEIAEANSFKRLRFSHTPRRTANSRFAMRFKIAFFRMFEYALTTKDVGLIFSKGLDPYGENIIYAFVDAGLRLTRPQGCRIVWNSVTLLMSTFVAINPLLQPIDLADSRLSLALSSVQV